MCICVLVYLELIGTLNSSLLLVTLPLSGECMCASVCMCICLRIYLDVVNMLDSSLVPVVLKLCVSVP